MILLVACGAKARVNSSNEIGVGITTYVYDGVGNIIQTDYPNDFNETNQYDELNRLTDKVTYYNHMGGIHWDYSYAYDNIGNITQIYENFRKETKDYEYDDRDRLTRITETPSADEIEYTYDGAGNRTSETVNLVTTANYSYDSANRMTARGATTFGYNNNGNRTSKTEGLLTTTYSYNYENQLKSITPPGGTTTSFNYSGVGNVIQKHTGGSPLGPFFNGGGGSTQNRTKVPKGCKWDPKSKGDWMCPRCYVGKPQPKKPEPTVEISDSVGIPVASVSLAPTLEPANIILDPTSPLPTPGIYLTNHQSSVTNVVDLLGNEMVAYEYDAFGQTTVVWGGLPQNMNNLHEPNIRSLPHRETNT